MAARGYDRPPDVCRNKLKGLRHKFNNHHLARARSGADNLEDLPNQDLLQKLLGGRPAAPAIRAAMDLLIREVEARRGEDSEVTFCGDPQSHNTDDVSTVAEGQSKNMKVEFVSFTHHLTPASSEETPTPPRGSSPPPRQPTQPCPGPSSPRHSPSPPCLPTQPCPGSSALHHSPPSSPRHPTPPPSGSSSSSDFRPQPHHPTRHPTTQDNQPLAETEDNPLSGTTRAVQQRRARRRAAVPYLDRVLAALDASQEEDRRAAIREEARDARDAQFQAELLEEMRAGRAQLSAALDAMRSIAVLADRQPASSRRHRSRSPLH